MFAAVHGHHCFPTDSKGGHGCGSHGCGSHGCGSHGCGQDHGLIGPHDAMALPLWYYCWMGGIHGQTRRGDSLLHQLHEEMLDHMHHPNLETTSMRGHGCRAHCGPAHMSATLGHGMPRQTRGGDSLLHQLHEEMLDHMCGMDSLHENAHKNGHCHAVEDPTGSDGDFDAAHQSPAGEDPEHEGPRPDSCLAHEDENDGSIEDCEYEDKE